MPSPRLSRPIAFLFLVLPSGISNGFSLVTLPFVLTKEGFPVALSASIMAIGIVSNVLRFLWGPVADFTLTLRRWYAGGVVASAASLLILSHMPFRQEAAGMLTVVVFLSLVATTFIVLPVGGLMAHTVAEEEKGQAAGWYQAGNLGGTGLGGGLGVWLATHYSVGIAGVALAAAMIACATALFLVPDVAPAADKRLSRKMLEMGHEFRELLRSPIALLTLFLFASPIGVGALSSLWSALSADWSVSPDVVALTSGLLSGFVSAAGCVAGGWMADRLGRWWAYFGSGVLIALVAIVMALCPRTAGIYVAGVLCYAFSGGANNAAFSALLLNAIGHGAASTKYATLASIGNLPSAYMVALDGWVRDRFGVGMMLMVDAWSGVLCVLLGLIALQRIRRPSAIVAGRPT